MVIRKHGRYPASWALTLIHNGIEYQGTLHNISLKRCAVTTSLPAFGGMQLRVQISVPDQSEPLRIQKAFVRWRRHDVIGLEFSQMGEAEQSRLGRVIHDLESARPKPSHALEAPTLISIALAKPTDQPQTVLVVDDEEAISASAR